MNLTYVVPGFDLILFKILMHPYESQKFVRDGLQALCQHQRPQGVDADTVLLFSQDKHPGPSVADFRMFYGLSVSKSPWNCRLACIASQDLHEKRPKYTIQQLTKAVRMRLEYIRRKPESMDGSEGQEARRQARRNRVRSFPLKTSQYPAYTLS